MAPTAVLLLAGLLLASPSWGKKPEPSKNLLNKISAQEQFDPAQFAGQWFLVGMVSQCPYLRKVRYRTEATTVVVSVMDRESLLFSTFRRLDGICWNIKQTYFAGNAQGHFLLKGREDPVDVVVGETDYSTYAILYFQRESNFSAKFYGRTARVAKNIWRKFKDAIMALEFVEDDISHYPKYGFCKSANQNHILDETKFTA